MKKPPALMTVVTAILLAACAGSSSVTTTAATSEHFDNVLVIGITGDYNTRAQFERVLVSELRKAGVDGTTWYSVAGGNKPVTRDGVAAAIDEHGFDSVLAVRRLDGDLDMQVKRSRTEIDATPIGGRIVNLFRSDYADYKTPESINFAASAELAVEFYSAASQDVVFAFDHQTRKEDNLGLLIDQTAATIVKRLDREHLLAR